MNNVRRHFLTNLRSDMARIWDCQQLVFKPLLFTFVLLYFTFFLKRYVPSMFMDLGFKDEVYSALVFVAISLIHGMLLANVFTLIWEQNDKINQSLRNGDLQLFKDNFYRRVPVQMKLFIFCLSVLMVYSVACVDLGSEKNNRIAVGIMLFVIILAWMAAYEMDDPFSGIWNIRRRVPKEWWEAIACDIEGSPANGPIRLKDIFRNSEALPAIADELIEKK